MRNIHSIGVMLDFQTKTRKRSVFLTTLSGNRGYPSSGIEMTHRFGSPHFKPETALPAFKHRGKGWFTTGFVLHKALIIPVRFRHILANFFSEHGRASWRERGGKN